MIFPKDSLYQLDDFHHTEDKADMHQQYYVKNVQFSKTGRMIFI
ncbi:hypothetical protein J699_02493 [Acinetobacter sp. 1000160]|nr:hypothetical protein ACINWC323_0406 [Acinetobacter sp. WC-323]EXB25183.1 hypothetical protein J537_2872 [Acinetobacter baumannii 1437282]EXB45883.1 hypothetical protein J522_3321 [Acinetobacter baumannii 146457]EYT18668.1 hypothetical protein J699_02493 [Acinetobacter sp. 1000160]